MKTLWALLLAALLALVACGSDSAGSDSNLVGPLADAITESGAAPISGDESTCVAEDIVSNIGEDRLNELGITPATVRSVQEVEFTDDELDIIVDAYDNCLDLEQLMVDELSANAALGDSADCVVGALGNDNIKISIRSALGGSDDGQEEFNADLFDALSECDVAP